MRHIWNDRRTFIALFAIGCLTALGFEAGLDVGGPIATVAFAIAASNAAQKAYQSRAVTAKAPVVERPKPKVPEVASEW